MVYPGPALTCIHNNVLPRSLAGLCRIISCAFVFLSEIYRNECWRVTARANRRHIYSLARYALSDQVGNCGLSWADMEAHYTLYYLPVRCRPTSVLAQVFGP